MTDDKPMSSLTRWIILAGVLALLLSAFVLPWTKHGTRIEYDYDDKPHSFGETTSGDYHLIYHPPQPYHVKSYSRTVYSADYLVDTDRLLLEWALIILVTAGLVLAAKGKRE